MEFDEVLALRKSVRSYTDEPVSEEEIKVADRIFFDQINFPFIELLGCLREGGIITHKG